DEQRVPRPVASRPALDACAIAELPRDVAGVQHVMYFRRTERDVMQPWSGAVEEHDVVGIALALEEDTAQVEGAFRRHVFGQPKSHARVKLGRLAHLWRQHLHMIEAQRTAAAMRGETRDHARLDRHARAKFER